LAKMCWKWRRLCGKIAYKLQKMCDSFTYISLLCNYILWEKIGDITFVTPFGVNVPPRFWNRQNPSNSRNSKVYRINKTDGDIYHAYFGSTLWSAIQVISYNK
jgi:hypothetical protein